MSRSSIWDFDVAIIGGGPGGLVSALYLRRFLRSIVIINGGKPRAAWIPKTHNQMAFPNGISGQDLLRRLNQHNAKLGTEMIRGLAIVNPHTGPDGYSGFEIIVEPDQSKLHARKVILATGFEDRQPALSNLNELRASGLLRYCPICDAYEYRNEVISVFAKDDSGIQRALFLARYTRKLHILVPAELNVSSARVHEIREARGAHESKIKIHQSSMIEVAPVSKRRGLCISMQDQKPFFTRVAYVELGCEIRDSAFRHLKNLRRTKEGFLITTTEQRTAIPGIFAVGDCVNLLGQISVAAGQAAVAATTIHNDLWAEESG